MIFAAGLGTRLSPITDNLPKALVPISGKPLLEHIILKLKAAGFDEIAYLGFPFSISETFQQRNTNSSISQSLGTVEQLQSIAVNSGKELVVYISMAFGNPYGDECNAEVAVKWTEKIAGLGVKTIALSDTVGLANAADVSSIFKAVIPALPAVKFGAHLHASEQSWRAKVAAAWEGGCRRFDSAMKVYGGCPMAEDELVGNLASEQLKLFLDEKQVKTNINDAAFTRALIEANTVFAEPLAT